MGKFLDEFGFRCAGWPLSQHNNWPDAWYHGNHESIFGSVDFRLANAYEDSPWWYPGFYEILYRRFPEARFILLERDPDSWFESMIKHSRGNILGKTKIHSKLYSRERDYRELLKREDFDEKRENKLGIKKMMTIAGQDEHYKAIYQKYNKAVKAFFEQQAPEALFADHLNNPDKWQNLAKFLGLSVPQDYACHEHRSSQSDES